jgi:hypothetical protein
MNQNPKQSVELMTLLNSLVSEDISDDEMLRLELALRDNPNAQDELLAYCQLHIDLMVELGADRAAKTFCDRQAQFATLAAPILMAEDGVQGLVPSNSRRMFGLLGWGALGGFTLCVALVVAGFVWSGASSQGDDPVAAAPIAVDSSQAPAVTSIQLGASSAEVGLEKIGRVTIHYPADFRLIGPMRARLNHGQIKVEVLEETGRGFIVETPDGEVTDLGTEFGLDVREGEKTGLVVFNGEVDLRVATTHNKNLATTWERLVKGDGVLFKKDDAIDRIMSVVSNEHGLFRPASALSVGSSRAVIAEVVDNLTSADTKRYYEIVAGGMREDALTYVDRLEHNWNGVDQWGMPSYLLGADYVKTFNDDKLRKDFGITLVLARPAKVYVLLDDRIEPPEWLKEDFRDTGDKLGLDAGAKTMEDKKNSNFQGRPGVGSGVSIDANFSIWERVVNKPGSVALGTNGKPKNPKQFYLTAMYGVAAVELKSSERE